METGGAESTGRGWRGLGLGTRLGLLLAGLAVLANALLLSLLHLNSRERIRDNARARLREAAALAALSLDVARHDRIAIPSSVEGADFQAVREALRRVMDQAPEANFVYTMRQDDQGRIVFVGYAGERHDPSAITSPGEVHHDASPFLREHFASLDRPVAERDFYTDKWGAWLTGYAPFFRADGTRAGVLGLDMSAAGLQAVEARYLRRSGLAFAVLVPVFLVLGVLLGRRLAAPVNALRDSAASLASGVFTSRVQVNSGGEIGDLAASFNAMADRVEAVFDGMLDELAERQVAEERLRRKEQVLEDVVRRRTGKLEAALAEAEARVEELERAHRLHAARCELGSRLVGTGGRDQDVRMVPLLMRAAEAVSGRLAAKPGVVLEMDLPEGLPDLYLDPDKALQAVVIILDNAIKHTAAGTVRLSARALGAEALQVRVQDAGPGVASEQRERISEGFFQGAQAPGEGVEPRGAGLGLAIARRIVEHYGGRIRVESEFGKGSTFFIEL